MKTKAHQFLPLGAAALLAAAILNAQAQNVQEILDLGPGTSAGDVLVNPFSDDPWPAGLLLSTYIPSPGPGYAVLSADLTQIPPSIVGVVDSFSMVNRKLASLAGALFAVGATMPGGNTAWHVRLSLDRGVTWDSLGPDWQLAAGKSASASGVAVDAAGRIFVCGRAADSRGNYHPIIRRSTDLGFTWTTVLNASKGANFDTTGDIQFVAPVGSKQGGIFAVGRVGNYWTVWRSRDGGATWPVVHSWVPSKGIAEATAITSDGNGNIYVGGMGNRVNYPRNWYVWRSLNSGDTWQDLGNTLPTATDNAINDLEVDASGNNLWVVGRSLRSVDLVYQADWTMQRWSPTGGWSAPIFPYANLSADSRAHAVATDATTGLFYASGWVYESDGQQHATVLEIGN